MQLKDGRLINWIIFLTQFRSSDSSLPLCPAIISFPSPGFPQPGFSHLVFPTRSNAGQMTTYYSCRAGWIWLESIKRPQTWMCMQITSVDTLTGRRRNALPPGLQMFESEVRRTFSRVKAGKATSPDRVPPCVFKTLHGPAGSCVHGHLKHITAAICCPSVLQRDNHCAVT